MNRLALIMGGLAAALALLLSACSSDPSLNGPFGNSPHGSTGSQCAWAPRGTVATFGMLSFSTKGGGRARIDKVSLVDAHNLRAVAEWAVRITGHDLVGVQPGYPPISKEYGPAVLAPGIHWAARQRADGATIVPTPFPDAINLVLVLRATGVQGTAKDVDIDYESGGTKYRLYFGVGIQMFNGNSRGCLAEG
jgi:hypothetical protein